LRGELNEARTRRQASFDFMVTNISSVQNWQRNQHYCTGLPLLAEGELALARQHLEKGLSLVGWPTEWGSMGSDLDMYAMLCEISGAQRDAIALQGYAARTEALAAECDHRLYAGIAERGWGIALRLGSNLAESEARLRSALEIFQSLGTRWQLGRTHAELGETAHMAGDTGVARTHFAAALDLFEQANAAPDAARMQKSLDQLSSTD